MAVISALWSSAKHWRRVRLGPVAIVYRMGRNVRVSNNSRRHLVHTLRKTFSRTANALPARASPRPELSGQVRASADAETALVVGVGPGLGFALARKLAASGLKVALASRKAERIDALVEELTRAGGVARAYGCDATDERSVQSVMARVCMELGAPHLVIYSVQAYSGDSVVDDEVAAFEEAWRQNCLGGFVVAREASRRMSELGRGTIILTGSTSSLIGRANHLNLAVGKFGLRALAQVLAREQWPNGIHVAHLVIDADIREDDSVAGPDAQANPDDIAEVVLALHRQPRSAWSSEVDIRPFNERFWEHC